MIKKMDYPLPPKPPDNPNPVFTAETLPTPQTPPMPPVEPTIPDEPLIAPNQPTTVPVAEETPPVAPITPIEPPVENKPSIIKKLLPIILILLVLVVGLVAIVKVILPLTQKSKEVTITYWGLWEQESIMNGIIADFQKDNPKIKVNYVFNSPKEYRERLSSAFAQDKGPDIFRYHNTWLPMFKGDLAPIPASVMNNATFESTYYPAAKQDLKSGNSYLGIPLEIDGLGMYINEDIFQNAGENPPTTWDELRKVANKLTTPTQRTRGNIQIAGVALGRTENIDHWSDILAVMMLQNGANLNKPTGQLAEDALTYFTLFSKSDLVWDETLPSSTQYFASGKLAIYFGPSWEAFNIKQANPQLKFKILPIPQLEDTNITWASYWVEGVSKKSANADAAWKFLKYLSEKESMQKLYQNASNLRLFGEPYSRTDMADLIKDADFVGSYVKQAPAAKSWYLSSRTFDNGLNDKIIKYFEDAVNSVNSNQVSAKDALDTASKGVSQVLGQYGISTSNTGLR